jgi:tRNA (adenine22-N1)-methyltransferase
MYPIDLCQLIKANALTYQPKNITKEESPVKLGKRLKQIEAMVSADYDHIWDCCCDHGLLGAALLAKHVAPNIHFVDVVPELMHQLENKLSQFFPKDNLVGSRWQVHCTDVAVLPLQKLSGKHLVVIAGVGGDLMTGFIKAIYQNNPNIEIDFLLCPVHHQFTLRQQLIEFNFSLLDEVLITENQRFYEVILVSSQKSDSNSAISPVGSLLWRYNTDEQFKNANAYLNKTIAHYRRMQLNSDSEIQHIINAYTAVTI